MPLGHKIRDLRLRQGLTVQGLADASGLSKGFISQVENGHTSPSIATLRDLAAALDTSMAYLVVEEQEAPHLVRRDQRPRLRLGGNTSRVEVLSAQPKRNLEVIMAELPPGRSAEGKRHYHHGEECVVCLEGRMRLTLGDRVIEMEEGDACHFDGRTPHAVENRGESFARVMIVMTPAAFEPLIRVARPTDVESGSEAAVPGLP